MKIKERVLDERGDVSAFAAIIIPMVILIFMFLVSKMDLFNIKQEIKYYAELSTKVASDTAVVMEDSQGNNICVILNDRGIERNNTYKQATETLYNNLSNPLNKSIDLGGEIIITAISTEKSLNAWGWNKITQRFDRPSSMLALNEYFKNGQVSMVITGYFKPNYLPIPDFWKGYTFTVPVSASCLS